MVLGMGELAGTGGVTVARHTRAVSLPGRFAAKYVRLKQAPSPATRRVRQDFLPTWGKFGGLAVLTMEPFAFPAARDLVYFPGGGFMTRSHWGLVADLANRLQARTHIVPGNNSVERVAGSYSELVASWFERPGAIVHGDSVPGAIVFGAIVIAGDGGGAELAEALSESALAEPKPDFIIPIPTFMRVRFLPETGEAMRFISAQVWGDESDES
jgi:acetyl esterase/lipase